MADRYRHWTGRQVPGRWSSIRRRIRRGIVLIVAAALIVTGIGAAVMALSSRAATAEPADGTYPLIVARSGLCLDVTGGLTENEANAPAAGV